MSRETSNEVRFPVSVLWQQIAFHVSRGEADKAQALREFARCIGVWITEESEQEIDKAVTEWLTPADEPAASVQSVVIGAIIHDL